MEEAEEHDGLFDAPIPFGSAKAQELIQNGNDGRLQISRNNTEVSASYDADDGMDHYIYTDPEADKAVWDVSQMTTSATTTTSAAATATATSTTTT